MSRFIPVEPARWAEMVLALSEMDRLKKENERLRRAGDNLERILVSKVASYEVGNASHEWQAAKGGEVQS